MIANILFHCYRRSRRSVRSVILKTVKSLERGECYSKTLRKIFKVYHGVEIGLYTYGGCFVVDSFDSFTTIGRYCSIAYGVRGMNSNHPMHFKSMHPFFYNPYFGYSEHDLLEYTPLTIGDDVWIGYDTNILPKVRSIGTGAVIGAGSIVTEDIPPYAVAVGNPARIIRYRFDKVTIEKLLASHWWELPMQEHVKNMLEFMKPYA